MDLKKGEPGLCQVLTNFLTPFPGRRAPVAAFLSLHPDLGTSLRRELAKGRPFVVDEGILAVESMRASRPNTVRGQALQLLQKRTPFAEFLPALARTSAGLTTASEFRAILRAFPDLRSAWDASPLVPKGALSIQMAELGRQLEALMGRPPSEGVPMGSSVNAFSLRAAPGGAFSRPIEKEADSSDGEMPELVGSDGESDGSEEGRRAPVRHPRSPLSFLPARGSRPSERPPPAYVAAPFEYGYPYSSGDDLVFPALSLSQVTNYAQDLIASAVPFSDAGRLVWVAREKKSPLTFGRPTDAVLADRVQHYTDLLAVQYSSLNPVAASSVEVFPVSHPPESGFFPVARRLSLTSSPRGPFSAEDCAAMGMRFGLHLFPRLTFVFSPEISVAIGLGMTPESLRCLARAVEDRGLGAPLGIAGPEHCWPSPRPTSLISVRFEERLGLPPLQMLSGTPPGLVQRILTFQALGSFATLRPISFAAFPDVPLAGGLAVDLESREAELKRRRGKAVPIRAPWVAPAEAFVVTVREGLDGGVGPLPASEIQTESEGILDYYSRGGEIGLTFTPHGAGPQLIPLEETGFYHGVLLISESPVYRLTSWQDSAARDEITLTLQQWSVPLLLEAPVGWSPEWERPGDADRPSEDQKETPASLAHRPSDRVSSGGPAPQETDGVEIDEGGLSDEETDEETRPGGGAPVGGRKETPEDDGFEDTDDLVREVEQLLESGSIGRVSAGEVSPLGTATGRGGLPPPAPPLLRSPALFSSPLGVSLRSPEDRQGLRSQQLLLQKEQSARVDALETKLTQVSNLVDLLRSEVTSLHRLIGRPGVVALARCTAEEVLCRLPLEQCRSKNGNCAFVHREEVEGLTGFLLQERIQRGRDARDLSRETRRDQISRAQPAGGRQTPKAVSVSFQDVGREIKALKNRLSNNPDYEKGTEKGKKRLLASMLYPRVLAYTQERLHDAGAHPESLQRRVVGLTKALLEFDKERVLRLVVDVPHLKASVDQIVDDVMSSAIRARRGSVSEYWLPTVEPAYGWDTPLSEEEWVAGLAQARAICAAPDVPNGEAQGEEKPTPAVPSAPSSHQSSETELAYAAIRDEVQSRPDFKSGDLDQRRAILGQLLFPRVQACAAGILVGSGPYPRLAEGLTGTFLQGKTNEVFKLLSDPSRLNLAVDSTTKRLTNHRKEGKEGGFFLQEYPPAPPTSKEAESRSDREVDPAVPSSSPRPTGEAREEAKKRVLGEALFPLIVTYLHNGPKEVPDGLPSKVTGMLLEMEDDEIWDLLWSPPALALKVNEALEVLDEAEDEKVSPPAKETEPKADPPAGGRGKKSKKGKKSNKGKPSPSLDELRASAAAAGEVPPPRVPPVLAGGAATAERRTEAKVPSAGRGAGGGRGLMGSGRGRSQELSQVASPSPPPAILPTEISPLRNPWATAAVLSVPVPPADRARVQAAANSSLSPAPVYEGRLTERRRAELTEVLKKHVGEKYESLRSRRLLTRTDHEDFVILKDDPEFPFTLNRKKVVSRISRTRVPKFKGLMEAFHRAVRLYREFNAEAKSKTDRNQVTIPLEFLVQFHPGFATGSAPPAEVRAAYSHYVREFEVAGTTVRWRQSEPF